MLAASPAYAHRLLITHNVVEKELHIEVFFEDDSPGDGAKVQIRQGETVLSEGRADETGRWKMALPAAGGYEIRAEHTGHVTKEQLTLVDEPGAATSTATSTPAPSRNDLVGVQWTRIGIGVGVIVGLMAGVLVTRCRK